MAGRVARMLGWGGGRPTLFFPSRCFAAAGLQEGVGDHRHQGVSVQPGPVIDPRSGRGRVPPSAADAPVADPPCFDSSGERAERRVGWQVRERSVSLAGRATLTDQPDLVARHDAWTRMSLMRCLRRTVGTRTRRATAKRACQPPLGAAPPADPSAIVSARPAVSAADRTLVVGMWCWRPAGPIATGKIIATSAG